MLEFCDLVTCSRVGYEGCKKLYWQRNMVFSWYGNARLHIEGNGRLVLRSQLLYGGYASFHEQWKALIQQLSDVPIVALNKIYATYIGRHVTDDQVKLLREDGSCYLIHRAFGTVTDTDTPWTLTELPSPIILEKYTYES